MNIQETRTKIENHMKVNRKIWMTALAVVLVALTIVLALTVGKRTVGVNNGTPVACAPGDNYNITNGELCPGADLSSIDCLPGEAFSIVTGEPCSTAQTAPSPETNYTSYADALAKYQGSILKLDSSCHGTPATVTVAPGTVVMVANDSTVTHLVLFADRTLSLRPYHYDLIVVKAGASYPVTCGGTPAGTIASI